jgi:DNA-binding transcriptional MerR regulator
MSTKMKKIANTQLKQTAFNFDFPESETQPEKVVEKVSEIEPKINSAIVEKVESIELPEVPSIITVEEEPIEIDFTPILEKKKEKVEKKKSTRGRMKISDMSATVDLIDIPEDEILFSKRYYSIGLVSEMFKVNHSLIRFWENEFDILKPKKNGKGDRLFRPEDVKNLKLIYHLLRERKYTIEGAKEFLKKSKSAEKKFEMIETLKSLKSFLHEIKAGL